MLMLYGALPGAGPEFYNNMEHSMNVAGNEDPKDSFFNNMYSKRPTSISINQVPG